jgi:DNA anti-recombination protein RmuC
MKINDTAYEQELKEISGEISKVMDDVGTTTDGVQIHVNHFGQWVAKYKTKDGKTFYAFGYDLLNAMRNLLRSPNQE